MRIFKYTLEITDHQIVMMPAEAKFLDIQIQNGEPQLWVLCDGSAPLTERHITMYGTGHHPPSNVGEYIATFQLKNGAFVFHAFETKIPA
jgi:hypothetical protein